MRVLSKRQVLMLHAALIAESGGCDGIRDEGLLDSAINTPLQTFAGKDLYPTVLEKAARGNKRIGTHAMLVFLAINSITLSYEDDDLINTILSVASGELDDTGLLNWLQGHIE